MADGRWHIMGWSVLPRGSEARAGVEKGAPLLGGAGAQRRLIVRDFQQAIARWTAVDDVEDAVAAGAAADTLIPGR